MTRKPDGWIAKKILGYHTSEPYLLIRLKFKTQLDNLKIDDLVAIVPPELLDWVEKARGYLEDGMEVADGTELALQLIEEINAILPEVEEK